MSTMGFQPLDTIGVVTRHLPSLASTGNFVKGDAIYLNSGLVTKAASGSVVCSIFGVAAADNAVASAVVPIYLADPKTVWVGEFDDTTSNAYVGQNYGLNITSGSMSVDLGETTNTLVRIVDLDPRDGVKSLGRVLFCWKSTAIQGNGAAD